MPTQRQEEKRVEECASVQGRERERDTEVEREEREREKERTHVGARENVLWLLLLYVLSSPRPALCKLGLARSAVCST